MLNLEKEIKELAREAKVTVTASDALHFSQAALNLAQTMVVLDSIDARKEK